MFLASPTPYLQLHGVPGATGTCSSFTFPLVPQPLQHRTVGKGFNACSGFQQVSAIRLIHICVSSCPFLVIELLCMIGCGSTVVPLCRGFSTSYALLPLSTSATAAQGVGSGRRSKESYDPVASQYLGPARVPEARDL